MAGYRPRREDLTDEQWHYCSTILFPGLRKAKARVDQIRRERAEGKKEEDGSGGPRTKNQSKLL